MQTPPNPIRRAVLHMQARRDHSQQELQRKLRTKGFSDAEIRAFFADTQHTSLLSDQRFTESYIRSRSRKGYGPIRIQMELQQRGISEEMIAEQLDITDNAWFCEAHRVWQKYCKGKPAQDPLARMKQARFLQYRGFTQEHIKYVLNEE